MFDQEAAFKSIVGPTKREEQASSSRSAAKKERKQNRVQRAYFIDGDLDKALRRMALEENKNLTESINEVLRKGLEKYIQSQP